jgi:DNA-directed RNA polymerase specialized sigma24 family protein
MRLTALVKREQALDTGAWVWTALPQGYPGSAGGRTIAELHEEVEALKHFFTGEDPATDISVDYIYELPGISPEILMDYRHGRSARDQAALELRRANDELGAKARAAAAALRAAGLSVRDSAALMGLSKSRFEQICS